MNICFSICKFKIVLKYFFQENKLLKYKNELLRRFGTIISRKLSSSSNYNNLKDSNHRGRRNVASSSKSVVCFACF